MNVSSMFHECTERGMKKEAVVSYDLEMFIGLRDACVGVMECLQSFAEFAEIRHKAQQ